MASAEHQQAMMLVDDTHDGLRRTALALHALDAVDRAWLLERIDPGVQPAVLALLQELTELGIAPDAQLIQLALQSCEVRTTAVALSVPNAQALCRALEMEAPVLQTFFLTALTETERRSVLGHWAGPGKPMVEPDAKLPIALREALAFSWRAVAERHREP